MKINIREDSIEVEGYVNAVERNSKTLRDRFGEFIERICKGTFAKAIDRNDDIRILLNHDRDIGGTKDGNLELHEDAIGLYARAVIYDPEVIEDGKNGDLVGWSFGFMDRPDGVTRAFENGMPIRIVNDIDLEEVSILNRKRSPAYEGTLVTVRAEDSTMRMLGEDMIEESEIMSETRDTEPMQEHAPEADKTIDYTEYESMIKEMKGETE